jgi:cell division protein FtsI/penicillin-binding protein 2
MKVVGDAMDAVSNHERGTAYRSRIEEEAWALAGKTGTSQVRRISLSERQSTASSSPSRRSTGRAIAVRWWSSTAAAARARRRRSRGTS